MTRPARSSSVPSRPPTPLQPPRLNGRRRLVAAGIAVALFAVAPVTAARSATVATRTVAQTGAALASAPPAAASPVGAHARPVTAPSPPALVDASTVGAAARFGCSTLSGLRVCSHGDDRQLRAAQAGQEGSGRAASTTSTRIGCYGDGRSGARIQAVYARPVTSPDRLPGMLASFRGWAGALEKVVNDSAHQTKGARHVRFATKASGAGCQLDVLALALPADAFSSFSATISALRNQGLAAKQTKYLVWADASGYCGMASMYDDTKPTADNFNNGGYPTYARIDRRCWGYAEAHEVVHMLGGVQKGAPHATAGRHCRDGNDLMCYDDGTAGSRQVATCPSSQAALLDCGHDDYFSTAPAAGSWLASHWNVAASAFLAPGWSDPAPTGSPAPTSDPQPAATASPGPADPSPKPSASPLLPLPLPTPVIGARS